MCWVYVLKNSTTNRYYVGSTNNLTRRIKQHLSGKTRTTRILRTTELVYTEEYSNIIDARTREKKIKSWKSKICIEKLINNGPVAQR